jgi:hypothetical protein
MSGGGNFLLLSYRIPGQHPETAQRLDELLAAFRRLPVIVENDPKRIPAESNWWLKLTLSFLCYFSGSSRYVLN